MDHRHNSLVFSLLLTGWDSISSWCTTTASNSSAGQKITGNCAISSHWQREDSGSLISLPGDMTGLVMGGALPLEAVQLQIVIMNMMIGSATVGSILLTYLCCPAFFTKAYQLEYKVLSADQLFLLFFPSSSWCFHRNWSPCYSMKLYRL